MGDTTLETIDASWTALLRATDELDEAQLTAPGPDGWTIRDHLGHLASWHQVLLAMLSGGDRYLGLGAEAQDTDTLNDAFRRRQAGLSTADVWALLRQTHEQVVARLEELGEEGLDRSYASYLPDAAHPNRDEPIRGWVIGNTSDHYDEHLEWIAALKSGAFSR